MLDLFKNSDEIEAGLDECARGTLFGRVYCAAVIMPNEIYDETKFKMIKDSKKLSKKKREEIANYIKEVAIDYSVNWCDEKKIDEINILQACQEGFHKCINNLKIRPTSLLVDGNYFRPYKNINHECIIKGDSKYISIAAASILAKVQHDYYIEDLCKKNPYLNIYDLKNNMGYGTKKHIESIKKNGISKYHRKTYGICKTY